MEIKNLYVWFLIALLLLFISFIITGFLDCRIVNAGENKYLQTSEIDKRKEVIRGSDDAESKGYLQKSNIDPRRTVQYDKNGEVKGYWQKSNIDPRKTIFHEK